MNSFYEYFAAQQKMAAYRQAKRMQRGVKLGYEQSTTSSSTIKLVSNPIPIGTSDFSIEFFGNTYGSKTLINPTLYSASQTTIYEKGYISMYQNISGIGGVSWVLFEKSSSGELTDDSVDVLYKVDDPLEVFHMVITREGTSVNVYINGELKGTKEQSAVKDLGDLQLAIANSSDIGLVRVWNMCLSADEIASLYNNGDPMGYIVPKAEKDMIPIEITSANTYTWDEEHTAVYHQLNFTPALPGVRKYMVNVTVSNYEVGNPYIYTGKFYYIPPENGTYNILIDLGTEEYKTYLPIYGGPSTTTRKLTLTVNSVTPVGLLAEYLPQNLMYGRDDKSIATSWLDSAKQLPLSDECLPPLFQSIGGYDMAANGAPEILYNE